MRFFIASNLLVVAAFIRLESVNAEYSCSLPAETSKFTVITEGDAVIEPKNVYTGVAIGGKFIKYSTSSMSVNGDAYMKSLSGSAINWNGQIKNVGCDLSEAIDFEHFKWLAENAQDSDTNGYKVVVKTKGGEYDTYDFRNGGQGEDNGKTLVVFNTHEDITITKTSDGRQFGPSIIAPFAKVYMLGQAGFIDGFVVAKEFDSNQGSNPSSAQLHGDTYKGTITCGGNTVNRVVDSNPTPSPTPACTTDGLRRCGAIWREANDNCAATICTYWADPICGADNCYGNLNNACCDYVAPDPTPAPITPNPTPTPTESCPGQISRGPSKY